LAQRAYRGVAVGVATQEAGMPHFFVTMAIARLLVKDAFDLGGQRINILSLHIRELLRVECLRQRCFGATGMVCRDIALLTAVNSAGLVDCAEGFWACTKLTPNPVSAIKDIAATTIAFRIIRTPSARAKILACRPHCSVNRITTVF